MRLLKVSLHITFQDYTWYRDFAKGEELILSGYLKHYNTDIVIGYLKQEPITCNSSVFYVKGYWNNSELILLETTKCDGLNNNSSITLCSYFPSVIDGNGHGYVDEATGIVSKEGIPFFLGGDLFSFLKIAPIFYLRKAYKSELNSIFHASPSGSPSTLTALTKSPNSLTIASAILLPTLLS